jgi:hypothetical protein
MATKFSSGSAIGWLRYLRPGQVTEAAECYVAIFDVYEKRAPIQDGRVFGGPKGLAIPDEDYNQGI